MIIPAQYHQKTVAVIGLGKAGNATANALKQAGANVLLWDDGNTQHNSQDTLESFPWETIAALFLSPGIPLTHPTPHPAVPLAQKAAIPIICDIEALYQTQHQAAYIAITGTNGKSTTTTLIGHILQSQNIPCEIGGNLGVPALELQPLDHKGVYVLELSSYQLDLCHALTPTISVLLNITPDHLERHGGIEGYIAAKKRIFHNQQENHTAIINIDNVYTQAIYQEIETVNKIPISTKKILKNGISVIDQTLYNKEKSYPLGKIKTLQGNHNAENIAAAIAATHAYGIPIENGISATRSFAGLAHRMEYLGEYKNITFINDSKATNAEATAHALHAFDNIYWIAGGQAKEGGITTLVPHFNKIHHAFLIGASQQEFSQTLQQENIAHTQCRTLENAYEQAVTKALQDPEKSVILLSPACASWDQWPNFEARGEAFRQRVKALHA